MARRGMMGIVFATLAGTFAGACGREAVVGDREELPPCAGAVSVAIGAGAQPAMSWQPACRTARVVVTPTADGAALPLWEVAALGGVAPPVSVGASPAGAQVFGAGARLDLGAAYTVRVVRGGGRGDPTSGVDSLTFTASAPR